MAAPIFVVVKTNGDIWIASDTDNANAIGGTVYKVNPQAAKQKICGVSGGTVTSTSKHGTQQDIS